MFDAKKELQRYSQEHLKCTHITPGNGLYLLIELFKMKRELKEFEFRDNGRSQDVERVITELIIEVGRQLV